MKNFVGIALVLIIAAAFGCSSSDESCDINTYPSTCLSSDMMETCTINADIVNVKCPTGFHCVNKTTADGLTSAVCEK